MNTDLILVIGIVIGVLTVPSILSAVLEGSAPRAASVSAVISGGLIVYAVYTNPGGYDVNDLPRLFRGVFSSFAN